MCRPERHRVWSILTTSSEAASVSYGLQNFKETNPNTDSLGRASMNIRSTRDDRIRAAWRGVQFREAKRHCADYREMCGASLIGGGPRSRADSLAKLTAMRQVSSHVNRLVAGRGEADARGLRSPCLTRINRPSAATSIAAVR